MAVRKTYTIKRPDAVITSVHLYYSVFDNHTVRAIAARVSGDTYAAYEMAFPPQAVSDVDWEKRIAYTTAQRGEMLPEPLAAHYFPELARECTYRA